MDLLLSSAFCVKDFRLRMTTLASLFCFAAKMTRKEHFDPVNATSTALSFKNENFLGRFLKVSIQLHEP